MKYIKPILEAFPQLTEHKSMIGYFIGVLMLVFVVSGTTSHLLLSWQEKNMKEQQIATMQDFLKEWNEKNDKLKSCPMRPVSEKQMDDVQTEILFSVQSHQLNLISMKNANKKKEQNGKSYCMEIAGPYEQVIRYLSDFKAKDALIGITYLKLEPQSGQLHAKMNYKIYAK